ncbi:MAG: type IV pilin protein [Gammaproteobacteria bacterium]
MTLAYKNNGFTLLELVIVIVIIAIIASIAYPTYSNFTRKGKLAEGTAKLSELRVQLERYYQDNRTYHSAPNTCGIPDGNGTYFSYTCTTTSPITFTWTASSLGNQGLGSAGTFVYSIDQDGAMATLKFNGSSSNSTCWELDQGQCI